MKNRFFAQCCAALCFLFAMATANAASITGELTDLGANQWSLDLTLSNNDAAGINEFSVYFSEALFSNLQILSTPDGWDSIVAQPDLFLSSAGFFDSYNPLALLSGHSQNGFSLSFTYLGQGLPSELAFDIFGDNFEWLSSGVSSPVLASVAEPAPVLLMLCGLVFLAGARRAAKR